MGARAVIVAHVRQQHVAQMAFAEDHDMINAFPADRSDPAVPQYAFCHGERGDVDAFYADRPNPTQEYFAERAIAICCADWRPSAPADLLPALVRRLKQIV